ncbi:hypothetical protein D9M68_371370 [compost metagenome]
MRTLAAIITASILVGCSTSAISPDQADAVPASSVYAFQQQTSPNDARVTFTRDAGYSGAACDFAFIINGRKAASVGISETATFYVPPGPAILGVQMGTICSGSLQELSVNLEPGTAYQFRGFRNASGDPGISATGRPPYRYSAATVSAPAALPATPGQPLSRDQWKQQQLQKLDQETGLSYEEYQRRYREIVGQ